MENIIITTNVKESDTLIKQAKKISINLNIPYIQRNKMTITSLLNQYSEVFVVYENKYEYINHHGKLFFHPNTAFLRIKGQRLNYNNEPLLQLIGSTPKKILDLTMGLAGDSIVMSYYKHSVTALESNPIIHCIVSHGLHHYQTMDLSFNLAMQNIQTICTDNLLYLKNQPDNSVDIIYLDPMFQYNIKESTQLNILSTLANGTTITDDLLIECRRVAKEKIIIKAHFKDDIFEKFKFTRIVRPNIKFHFGVIEI